MTPQRSCPEVPKSPHRSFWLVTLWWIQTRTKIVVAFTNRPAGQCCPTNRSLEPQDSILACPAEIPSRFSLVQDTTRQEAQFRPRKRACSSASNQHRFVFVGCAVSTDWWLASQHGSNNSDLIYFGHLGFVKQGRPFETEADGRELEREQKVDRDRVLVNPSRGEARIVPHNVS
ncbi:predicted protein [Histoplasma capsulatum H143]|uniref:Uncharacterized protein n=1 Tax=Ajellomyces capsulatus (strain H143) TaxID=544712 RepID=C6HRX4_AJECH|nr:predicted protein [Histoplasma capsulatum H143]